MRLQAKDHRVKVILFFLIRIFIRQIHIVIRVSRNTWKLPHFFALPRQLYLDNTDTPDMRSSDILLGLILFLAAITATFADRKEECSDRNNVTSIKAFRRHSDSLEKNRFFTTYPIMFVGSTGSQY